MSGPAVDMLDVTSVVQRSDDLAAGAMGDELAMMSLHTGTYFILDKVAARIWERMSNPVAVVDLVDELLELYDVAPNRCEADVLAFLQKLLARGLVRVLNAQDAKRTSGPV
jgi:hypothetical protein